MSESPTNPLQNDRNDIWSLADTLPLNQVIALARELAAQGDAAAQAFLGKFAQEDERQSYRQQAADGGDLPSMLELAGQSLANGDNAQALMWFERAAAQGNAEAHVRLGIMIAKGQGVTPDPIAAITRICTARQTRENDAYIEFVLDEQDYPFDQGDMDVYYPHVIERIFGDYNRLDKQRVYDYLHQLGMQPESEDEAWASTPTLEGTPAQEDAPKWLTQFLRGLASQSESTSRHARLLTAVLEGVHLLRPQQAESLEVVWFDALHRPEAFMAQLKQRFPVPPLELKVLYEGNHDALKEATDAVWPSLRHAYRRVQQKQREREDVAVATHSPPVQTTTSQTGKVRFAPYKYNITPMRCGNRACTWTGIMTETVNQRCPVCKSYLLIRNGGWKLLNGSIFAKQRDSLIKAHVSALRTIAWFMYSTSRDYHALAAAWGNAAHALAKTR